jgi:hypothetical protein
MKMKFGAIVVDGRGKIGGHVASKNRTSAYLRTKVTPVNAQTSFQLGVRNVFTGFAQAWRGLSQAERDAWNAAVADYARTNVFGDSVQPTGFNLFQRLNNNLSIAGQAQIDTPPLPAAVGVVVADSLTAAVAVPAMSLVLDAAVPAATAVKVFATAPMSAGKSFVKNLYRLITVLAPAATTPVDLLAAYTAKFGSTGSIGQKIFVKVEAINAVTGQTGQPSEVSVITVA